MDIEALYRGYIDCLNRQDWDLLGQHVHEKVEHNGRPFGLAGYRRMLEGNFADIPDLRFEIDFLVCEAPRVAARLLFDCMPVGKFMDLPVNGRRVTFSENVFYEFADGRIQAVWSVIDKTAIASQL